MEPAVVLRPIVEVGVVSGAIDVPEEGVVVPGDRCTRMDEGDKAILLTAEGRGGIRGDREEEAEEEEEVEVEVVVRKGGEGREGREGRGEEEREGREGRYSGDREKEGNGILGVHLGKSARGGGGAHQRTFGCVCI